LRSEPYVQVEDVRKIYPDGVQALRGVTVDFRRGEVHGLLGENGAGKSTLMRILFGQIRPTGGRILINGGQVNFSSPHDAITHRIGMVFQHFMLISSFTGLENIMLGLETGKGFRSERDVRKSAEALALRLGLKVDLDETVENMPMGERQRVEILKLLVRNVDLLILDEPTSALTPFETDELLKVMRRLKDEDRTIVFVTHKLREALSACDRITVMRKGAKVDTVEGGAADVRSLALMMVGREILPEIKKGAPKLRDLLLEVRKLTALSDTGNEALKDVSFQVRGGEIFGIAGVAGNGQKELVEIITGLRRAKSGVVLVGGVETTTKSPREIYDLGLAHIPEDRFGRGVVLPLSVRDNLLLGLQFRPKFEEHMIIRQSAVDENARDLIRTYSIAATEDTPVKSLSGGNIQRVVVAREFSKSPLIIVASQPTTGLDISATEFVRQELLKMRDEGKAVLLISSELEEVTGLSDTMAVMYEGQLAGFKRPEEFTAEEIGLMMGGVKVG
jgi:ABC-type uncharacterized transport system ATPase subunit